MNSNFPEKELKERFLDLLYGLLEDDEAERLRRLIATDAAAARLFDEARETADLLARSARCEIDEKKDVASSKNVAVDQRAFESVSLFAFDAAVGASVGEFGSKNELKTENFSNKNLSGDLKKTKTKNFETKNDEKTAKKKSKQVKTKKKTKKTNRRDDVSVVAASSFVSVEQSVRAANRSDSNVLNAENEWATVGRTFRDVGTRRSGKIWRRSLNALRRSSLFFKLNAILALLGLSTAIGLATQEYQLRKYFRDDFRVQIAAPSALARDVPQTILATTTGPNGKPRRIPIRFCFTDANTGEFLLAHTESGDASGVARFEIPDLSAFPDRTLLTISAGEREIETIKTVLPVVDSKPERLEFAKDFASGQNSAFCARAFELASAAAFGFDSTAKLVVESTPSSSAARSRNRADVRADSARVFSDSARVFSDSARVFSESDSAVLARREENEPNATNGAPIESNSAADAPAVAPMFSARETVDVLASPESSAEKESLTSIERQGKQSSSKYRADESWPGPVAELSRSVANAFSNRQNSEKIANSRDATARDDVLGAESDLSDDEAERSARLLASRKASAPDSVHARSAQMIVENRLSHFDSDDNGNSGFNDGNCGDSVAATVLQERTAELELDVSGFGSVAADANASSTVALDASNDNPVAERGVVVRFYPEIGRLVADYKNIVCFSCVDAQGSPIAASFELKDGSGNILATAETSEKGIGAFALTPKNGEIYSLQTSISREENAENTGVEDAEILAGDVESSAADENAEVDAEKNDENDENDAETVETESASEFLEFRLPNVASGSVYFSPTSRVFESGASPTFDVRTNAKIPLALTVEKNGVSVAQRVWIEESGKRRVAVRLAPRVCGLLHVSFYRCEKTPFKKIGETTIYRKPTEELNLDAEIVRSADPARNVLNLRATTTDPDAKTARLDVFWAPDVDAALAELDFDEILLGTSDEFKNEALETFDSDVSASSPILFDNLTAMKKRVSVKLEDFWRREASGALNVVRSGLFGCIVLATSAIFFVLFQALTIRRGAILVGSCCVLATLFYFEQKTIDFSSALSKAIAVSADDNVAFGGTSPKNFAFGTASRVRSVEQLPSRTVRALLATSREIEIGETKSISFDEFLENVEQSRGFLLIKIDDGASSVWKLERIDAVAPENADSNEASRTE